MMKELKVLNCGSLIATVYEDGTVRWKCPQCGEEDPKKVKTSYRICGYISNYTPTEGRSQDIMNRVKHLN